MDAHEKHCGFKLRLTIEDVRGIWSEADDKVRLEILKSLIWTAPDSRGFSEKALKLLSSPKFWEDVD